MIYIITCIKTRIAVNANWDFHIMNLGSFDVRFADSKTLYILLVFYIMRSIRLEKDFSRNILKGFPERSALEAF